ncbi:MAG: cation:proton antiporter, partial [Longispora sp.]|nr:cation:proton antiporter [Longispora sp. (in: high G+C Gram-positive bacteria)]
ALSNTVLKRLPLSAAIFYLAIGYALGPAGVGMIDLNAVVQAPLLERLTEVAVVISLFSAGLKLRRPLSDGRWHSAARLAFVSMAATVAMIAVAGVVGLDLPLGAAILLGAILAPTDPVLAADVQVASATDEDELRFSLTGEAGLNDGTAFPFVMLGLGLLGLHEIGAYGWRWLAVDVVWATVGGLGIGTVLGTLVGQLVLYLRRTHKEAVGLDDFLGLGLIALSYGVALLLYTYGFLAVFAAGLALRRIERRASEEKPPAEKPPADVEASAEVGEEAEVATDPEKAPAYMAQAVLGFNEQLDNMLQVGLLILLGGILSFSLLPPAAIWFVPLLFLVVRPVAVNLGMIRSQTTGHQRALISWIGIRGIGSIYYLMYAIVHEIPPLLAERLTALVFAVVVVSAVVHGISVTPLMGLYGRKGDKTAEAPE